LLTQNPIGNRSWESTVLCSKLMWNRSITASILVAFLISMSQTLLCYRKMKTTSSALMAKSLETPRTARFPSVRDAMRT
jgi:hypothetical protein